MAEIWKPQMIDVYKDWCEVLMFHATTSLTNWEEQFINSIYMQIVQYGRNLTENQAIKLEDIYARCSYIEIKRNDRT